MIKWEINFPKVDNIILHFTLILTSSPFPHVYVFIAPEREMFCVAEHDSLLAFQIYWGGSPLVEHGEDLSLTPNVCGQSKHLLRVIHCILWSPFRFCGHWSARWQITLENQASLCLRDRKLDCVPAVQSVHVWFSSSQLFFSFFPFKTCHAYIVNLWKQPASLIQNVSGFIVRSLLFFDSTDDVLLIMFAVITAFF